MYEYIKWLFSAAVCLEFNVLRYAVKSGVLVFGGLKAYPGFAFENTPACFRPHATITSDKPNFWSRSVLISSIHWHRLHVMILQYCLQNLEKSFTCQRCLVVRVIYTLHLIFLWQQYSPSSLWSCALPLIDGRRLPRHVRRLLRSRVNLRRSRIVVIDYCIRISSRI